MVQDFMTNIYHKKIRNNIDDDGSGLFSQTRGYNEVQFKISTYLLKSILCYEK